MVDEDRSDSGSVWEFMAMVKAALYAGREMDDATPTEYAESTWECYQVVERRVRESDTTVTVGVPQRNKEESVKTIAEKKFQVEGEELMEMKAYYGLVPTPSNTGRFE